NDFGKIEVATSGEYWKLIVSILVCQGAGYVGSFFTIPSLSVWYENLKKPFFNPPSWIFSPVWISLFILMGISLFIIWRKSSLDEQVSTAIVLFTIQLALNVLWSVTFFHFRSPLGGVVVIVFLWMAIFFTMWKFYFIDRTAAFLLVPYLSWVSFAGVLNTFLFLLNRKP
ncbi:MAG: TspO/MBR family protein, partial [Atribacterota bacterium]